MWRGGVKDVERMFEGCGGEVRGERCGGDG